MPKHKRGIIPNKYGVIQREVASSGGGNSDRLPYLGITGCQFLDTQGQFPDIIQTSDLVPMGLLQYDIGEDTGIGQITASACEALLLTVMDPSGQLDVQSWQPGGNGVNSWIKLKLSKARRLGSFMVRSKSDSCPTSLKIEGSNDDTNWVTLFSSDALGTWAASYESKTFTLDTPSEECLYFRLTILASAATTLRITKFRMFRPTSEVARGDILVPASSLYPLSGTFTGGNSPLTVSLIDTLRLERTNMALAGLNSDVTVSLSNLQATTRQNMGLFLERDMETGDLSLKLALLSSRGLAGLSWGIFPTSIAFPAGYDVNANGWRCYVTSAGGTKREFRAAFDDNDATSAQSSWNGQGYLTRLDGGLIYIEGFRCYWSNGNYGANLYGILPDGSLRGWGSMGTNQTCDWTDANYANFIPGWYKGIRWDGTDGSYIKTLKLSCQYNPLRLKMEEGQLKAQLTPGVWTQKQMIPLGRLSVSSEDVFVVNRPSLGLGYDSLEEYNYRTMVR